MENIPEIMTEPEVKGRGQKGKKGNEYEYKVKRFQYYDPTIKRMRVKVINLATSTEEEAELKGRQWIEEMKANIEKRELYRTFNMGIGFIVVVKKSEVNKAQKILAKTGMASYQIGEVVKRAGEKMILS